MIARATRSAKPSELDGEAGKALPDRETATQREDVEVSRVAESRTGENALIPIRRQPGRADDIERAFVVERGIEGDVDEFDRGPTGQGAIVGDGVFGYWPPPRSIRS